MPDALELIFPGNTELASRMRTHDWSGIALGPPRSWPRSLRVALGICLTSPIAMQIWWGPSLTFFYNDACIPLLGSTNHPSALGRSGSAAWADIWPAIGPCIDRVRATGRAGSCDSVPVCGLRSVRHETSHVTFSFSPVLNEDGEVEGIFGTCTQTAEAPVPHLESPQKQPITPTRAARILVVDDDANVRRYVTQLLGQHWAVEAASDGVHALQALHREEFHLVLADVVMPRLDGMALVRVIRASEKLATLPVILLSARGGEEERIAGLDSGANDYLVKPLRAGEIVARVRAHLELSGAARRDAAHRAKEEFIAMLGHELRNPLAPILSAVHVLTTRHPQSREVSIIERQATKLARLVDDLLDASRITSGKVLLHKRQVELCTIVHRAVEMARASLHQRRQQLTVDVAHDGLVVDVDPDRLVQVVANLVANASKYSDEDARISVIAATRGDRVILSVQDSGIGLTPELKEQIFQLFVQQSQTLARSQGGLGVGLAIVRGLTELHGGNVRAESDGPGKGSRFTIELPLSKGNAAALSEQSEVPLSSSVALAPRNIRRVLVVDDNVDSADLTASLLSDSGFEVAVAHDGLAALELAQRFEPDACLLDIGLPTLDGYELARRLNDMSEGSLKPHLVAMTGYGQARDRERSRQAGFKAHLVKPVPLSVLIRALTADPANPATG